MAATIISNMPPYSFGQMTNQTVGRLISSDTSVRRLAEAIATASAGFQGTDGTQFEVGNTDPENQVQNLFGVQADVNRPGEQGKAYAYAIGRLNEAWTTFWETAQPFIEQLDNGQASM